MRVPGKVIFALLGLLLLLPLQGRAQVNAEQVMNIGRNVLSMDDYMLAIQYFNRAIKAKPYLADPYFYRALAKLQLEDYAGSEADCDLALDRNPFKTEAYKLRGFARQQLGQDSLAIEDYDKGLQHNPREKYFLFYKAIAQTNIKHFEEADSTFSLLIKSFPAFEDAYSARANMHLQRADTVAALQDLDKALDMSKNMLNAHLMKAYILGERQQWKEALEHMDAAIKLEPREPDYYVNRAYLRYNDNDYFGAMADYNYTLDLDPTNSAAIFNRALLRFEVRDLMNAAADFSKILEKDPENFHAIYNRALIYMDTGQPRAALADFDRIIKRYPKFYPAYYGKAQIYQEMGQTRNALENYYKGEDMVRKYVKNPTKNPLDRPTIQPGKSNSKGREAAEDESEIEVMERFNQLVTVSHDDEGTQALSFNEKIKGKVQDRSSKISPEPVYTISLYDDPASLKISSNWFKALDEFNHNRYIRETLYLVPGEAASIKPDQAEALFARIDDYAAVINRGAARPADYLGRGIIYLTLKDYEAAGADFDKALALAPDFEVALMARAGLQALHATSGASELMPLRRAITDYDALIRLNPNQIYALYNKGVLSYNAGDYSSALEAFSRAIAINSDFGNAYYNRGLTYLQLGDKAKALADLSKAGELGVVPSYNLLKKMK